MTAQNLNDLIESARDEQQFVRFALNDEEYAVGAVSVQEIIRLGKIRSVPHLPAFLKGVINLRGTIIPVIDLKLKFGMTSDGYDDHTCIIVTEFSGGVMGLIVDEVSDVLRLSENSIAEKPSFGTSVNADFIKGVGNADESMIIILDVEKVLSDREVEIMNETREPSPED